MSLSRNRQTGDGWWLVIFILIFKVSIFFSPDEVRAICSRCLSIYGIFILKLEESAHLFPGSSYVNGPGNCSLDTGWTQQREEHKNTRFVMTSFTANTTERQVLQNGRTIHQTEFWCHSNVKKYANFVEVNIITHKISWWIMDQL